MAFERQIIWPLKEKLSVPLAFQSRPNSAGNAAIAKKPVNLPWNTPRSPFREMDSLSRFTPSVVHELLPSPTRVLTISGVTKDSSGVALGSCVVRLYRTLDDQQMESVTSDASGNFTLKSIGPAQTYYLVAYKPGGTDVAGTTLNTLTGS